MPPPPPPFGCFSRCNLRGGQPVLLNHVAIGWKSRRRPPTVELDSPANTILTLPSTRWRCWHPEQERLLAVSAPPRPALLGVTPWGQ